MLYRYMLLLLWSMSLRMEIQVIPGRGNQIAGKLRDANPDPCLGVQYMTTKWRDLNPNPSVTKLWQMTAWDVMHQVSPWNLM
eukprot:3379522-Karenia_brevis.AAC.1